MSEQHTQEPWKVVGQLDDEDADINAKSCTPGWDGHVSIALSVGKVNARRIVACVNWCQGNSTEGMARAVSIGRPYVVERDTAMERERSLAHDLADLLESAERLLSRKRPGASENDHRLILEIDCLDLEDVIARVKGGAA